jgi:hypothetical protein
MIPCVALLALLSQDLDTAPRPAGQTALKTEVHSGATASDSPVSVDLSIDVNRSGAARWSGFTPSVTFVANRRWSFEAGLPLFAVNGALSDDGQSHVGLGDAYGTVYFDLSSEATTFYTSASASAPTGSVRKGLGFGQVTWEWSNHVERSFGRVTPYGDGGISNGLDLSNRASHGRRGARAPAPIVGRVIDGESGVAFGFSDAVSLSVSGYLTQSWGAQSTVTATGPRGKRAVVLSTANQVRDRGWSADLSVSTGRMADLSVWFWRSQTFYSNTLSVSLVLHLWEILHRTP